MQVSETLLDNLIISCNTLLNSSVPILSSLVNLISNSNFLIEYSTHLIFSDNNLLSKIIFLVSCTASAAAAAFAAAASFFFCVSASASALFISSPSVFLGPYKISDTKSEYRCCNICLFSLLVSSDSVDL